ncbi:MAG: hypothetical protein K0S35_3793 [Geminicoccaceae bacterium]|jgi:hypothetical protein|nr:hypothetical protein [Geminicoccaceae bacterium]
MAPMTLQTFRASLSADVPPAGLSPALQALWQEAKGDWHAAHALAQAQDDAEGAWVHAYLHRVEGDLANAGYWYRRAARPASNESLQEEWAAVVAALLAR